jgi:ATP-binding cassette subfamily B protein RaxB
MRVRKVAVPDALPGLTRHRVPVILQQERAECGLACLTMVAAGYGRYVSLDTLRNRFRGSGHGATLGDLLHTARHLRLIARPLKLSLSEIGRLQLPAVLHWRMNHFVVLTKTGRRHVRIHDPATGRRTISRTELDESFTGIALEFSAQHDFLPGKEESRVSFRSLIGQVRRLYRYLGVMLFLLLTSQLLALVPSIATQILIDEVVLGQDRVWLNRALGGLAVIMLLTIMLDGLRSWVSLYTGTKLAVDSTVSLMAHVLSLPVTFVQRRHLGDLMSKLESLTPVRLVMTDHAVSGIVNLVVLLTTMSIMLLYSPALTLISVVGLLASTGLLVALLPSSRRIGERMLIHRAAENSSLVETLRGYETVSVLGLGNVRRLQWQNHFLQATGANVQQGKLAIIRSSVSGLIGTLEQVTFLAVGIGGVLEREVTVGVLFAFMSLRGRFGGAALGLMEAFQRFALLKVHIGRLSDLALATPQRESPPGAVVSGFSGNLRASDLSFGFAEGDLVFGQVSCDISAGTHAVITGPSGSGKTTLLKILAGQLEPRSGQVLFDGIEMSLWDRDTLRGQIGMVMQNDNLFQGSVAMNIAAFSPLPDLARVRSAAVAAEIWDDIQKLPMRTETLIGDTGLGLSGGQVQRLILARALYNRPRILFLDEATSHLDVETEARVLENIDGLNITIVSVAHRPGAIRLAGQVISLGAV